MNLDVMTLDDFMAIAWPALGFIAGWIAKHYAEIYATSRKKLHEIRSLVDDVDEAVQDDKVTEQEFRKIWNDAREVIKK